MKVGAEIVESQPSTPFATVKFDYVENALELSSLKRSYPTLNLPNTQLSFHYYYPLIQKLHYSNHDAGPQGNWALTGGRQYRNDLSAYIVTQDEKRMISPDAEGASVMVAAFPGQIKETWTWSDGVILTRDYFQSPTSPSQGIRFVMHNLRNSSIHGVRLSLGIKNSEVDEKPTDPKYLEMDDEFLVDPRDAIIYQRDYIAREESWIALGWSSESGLISSADGEIHPNSLFLETPATDLAPGQSITSIFWFTYGSDQNQVRQQMMRLRKNPAYSEWESQVKEFANQGMSFQCQDKYFSYLVETYRAWSGWLNPTVANVASGFDCEMDMPKPEHVLQGMAGYLAWEKQAYLKEYIIYWLSQRNDTSDIAYSIILACEYFRYTADRNWIRENYLKIIAQVSYLLEMDQNYDGIPEYISATERQEWENKILPVNLRDQTHEIEFLKTAIISLWAQKSAAELSKAYKIADMATYDDKLHSAMERAKESIESCYWDPEAGVNGYYYHAWVPEKKTKIKLKSADAIWLFTQQLGDLDHSVAIFQDLWQNRQWRMKEGAFYNSLLNDKRYYFKNKKNKQKYNRSTVYEILMAGMKFSESASSSVNTILALIDTEVTTSDGFVLSDVEYDVDSGLNPGNFSVIRLILQGFCGLEPKMNGLQITLPTYTQDLNIQIKQWKCRGALIDCFVMPGVHQKGYIKVNGKKYNSQKLFVPDWSLKEKRLKIELFRPELLNLKVIKKKKPAKLTKRKTLKH